MTLRLLRLARYAAIVGIFVVAGFYAGRMTFPPADAPTSSAVIGAKAPDLLPNIRLADLDGNVRSLRDWSDGPLLINFWATWCAPCLREMPLLETAWQARRADGLTIIGVAVDRTEAVPAYVERTGVSYPILVGQSDAMEAAEAFGPDFAGLPYSIFVAAGGQIAGVYSGELHADHLERVLDVLDAVSAGRISIDAARSKLAD